MKRSIYIVLFLVQYCVAIGQSNVAPVLDLDWATTSDLKVYPMRTFDQRDKSFIGSSLLFGDWQNARIKLVDKDQFLGKIVMVNYDLYAQVFIVKYLAKLFELPPEDADKIMIEDVENRREEEYKFYKDDSGNYGFFKILVEGKIQLLERSNIKIIEPDYNAVLNVGNVRPKFVQWVELYITRNGKMYKLPKKRNQISESLEQESEVARFLIEEKVNPKDKAKLKAAILKFNSNINR